MCENDTSHSMRRVHKYVMTGSPCCSGSLLAMEWSGYYCSYTRTHTHTHTYVHTHTQASRRTRDRSLSYSCLLSLALYCLLPHCRSFTHTLLCFLWLSLSISFLEQDGGLGCKGTLSQNEQEGWWRVKWEVGMSHVIHLNASCHQYVMSQMINRKSGLCGASQV